MTEAEKIYERFVNYEWNEVSESLKESILKAINEALKQGQSLPIDSVVRFSECKCDQECKHLDCSVIKCKQGNKK
jgi:hypothetical protein